jgi:protease I
VGTGVALENGMARIAIPLANDFEDSEYAIPYGRLREAGHEVTVVGHEKGDVVEGKRGEATVPVDAGAGDLDPKRFDLLLIPGGWSPDHLRTDRDMMTFVRGFTATGRPVAAVCHGPQLLIEADAVRGRTVTSAPSVRRDLENAGAHWVDREVVEDGNLITSRKPADLEAFSDAVLRALR